VRVRKQCEEDKKEGGCLTELHAFLAYETYAHNIEEKRSILILSVQESREPVHFREWRRYTDECRGLHAQ